MEFFFIRHEMPPKGSPDEPEPGERIPVGELPRTIPTAPGTSYMVVETHKRDATGGIITARALYGKETESFRTYAAREDGICVAHGTNILWR